MFKSVKKDGIRMYRIQFSYASDLLNHTVRKPGPPGDELNIDKSCTLEDMEQMSIIVQEDEIPMWKDFGGGIASAEFIGYYVEPFPPHVLEVP